MYSRRQDTLESRPRHYNFWSPCRIGRALWPALLANGLPRFAQGSYTDAKPLKFRGNFDPFRVLQLPKGKLPPADIVKKAFKKGALRWHPDRCKRTTPVEECETRMEEVKLAQEVLSDDRKLQQWEAWDEDRRGGGPKPEGGRTKPFGQPAGSDSFGNMFGGGGGSSFGGFGNLGQGRPRRPAQRPPPAPRPRPRPPEPPTQEMGWRLISTEKSEGRHGSQVELITRERDLPGTPMIQVESVERTCYDAQVQCAEKVLERRRRRKDAEL